MAAPTANAPAMPSASKAYLASFIARPFFLIV
jgi:hypothetical protein